MAKTVKSLKNKEARVLSPGGRIEILATEGADAAKAPSSFKMILYTGQGLKSYYWGTTYLDLTGFKPSRANVPAMLNHYEVVGSTLEVRADKAAKEISCSGTLLAGTMEEEPAANMVKRRLAQKHPYQASGRWQPKAVEDVGDGIKATVNGEEVTGPCTIFREFGLVEASFADLGADDQTSAIAASADETVTTVEIEGDKTMTTPANKTILASLLTLKEIFGGDKAIDLQASKPEAADILAFLPDIVGEVKGLRASLATAEGKVKQLETDLAAAKAAPAVVLPGKADPSSPAVKAKEDTALAAAACKDEQQVKAEYENSEDIRAQFASVEIYRAYREKNAKPAK